MFWGRPTRDNVTKWSSSYSISVYLTTLFSFFKCLYVSAPSALPNNPFRNNYLVLIGTVINQYTTVENLYFCLIKWKIKANESDNLVFICHPYIYIHPFIHSFIYSIIIFYFSKRSLFTSCHERLPWHLYFWFRASTCWNRRCCCCCCCCFCKWWRHHSRAAFILSCTWKSDN